MSDTKDETEPTEEPTEEPTPAEPTPEEQEEGETPEPVEEPSDEPGGRTVSDERTRLEEVEIEAVEKALDRERKLHAKRLSGILGDASADTLLCPLCGDGLQGFLYPGFQQSLSEEALGNVAALVGVAGPSEYRMAEGVVECDRCDGLGKLRYPTKVEHVELQMCPKCSGNGYVSATQTAETRVGHAIEAIGTAPAGNGTAAACPLCGQAGMAGQPHWCSPQAAPVG